MSAELSANQLFAIARSEFLDAHNEIDIAIRELLLLLKQAPKQLMSQNVEALAKQPAGPQYSKAEKTRIEGVLSELKPFNGLRCDIVHSRMEVIAISGENHAYFANVQEQSRYGQKGLVLSLQELGDAKDDLRRIAQKLRIKRDLAVVKTAAA